MKPVRTTVDAPAEAEHLLQLFDEDGSRIQTVAAFVRGGLEAGDRVLLVITPEHWTAVAGSLPDLDLAGAVAAGRVTVRDAGTLLRTFMHRGLPDFERFDAAVVALIRQLTADGSRLRVFGEMVDMLAVEGDFEAVRELEALWNQLLPRHPLMLCCGYSAVSFGDPRSAGVLRTLCHAHTRVLSAPGDLLGTFLLETCR